MQNWKIQYMIYFSIVYNPCDGPLHMFNIKSTINITIPWYYKSMCVNVWIMMSWIFIISIKKLFWNEVIIGHIFVYNVLRIFK